MDGDWLAGGLVGCMVGRLAASCLFRLVRFFLLLRVVQVPLLFGCWRVVESCWRVTATLARTVTSDIVLRVVQVP